MVCCTAQHRRRSVRMMSARSAARRQLWRRRSRSLCRQAGPPPSIFIRVCTRRGLPWPPAALPSCVYIVGSSRGDASRWSRLLRSRRGAHGRARVIFDDPRSLSPASAPQMFSTPTLSVIRPSSHPRFLSFFLQRHKKKKRLHYEADLDKP